MSQCINCPGFITSETKPVLEMALVLPDGKRITRSLCPKCIASDYIKNDRLMRKMYEAAGFDMFMASVQAQTQEGNGHEKTKQGK
jgi:hypothetical protein